VGELEGWGIRKEGCPLPIGKGFGRGLYPLARKFSDLWRENHVF